MEAETLDSILELKNRRYNVIGMSPVRLCIGLGLAFLAGCGKNETVVSEPVRPAERIQMTFASDESPSVSPGSSVVSTSIPIDESAKKLGAKVYSKVDARILRSPREGSLEYYRIGRGVPMYVNRTSDPNWLQVRMSRGRSGYVRTDQTNAALALALAQERLDDKQRLSPKPNRGNEPDVGDGKSSGTPARDPEIDEAIDRLETGIPPVEEAFSELQAAISRFQAGPENWQLAKEGSIQALNFFQGVLSDLTGQIQAVAAHSAGFNANERSAYNAAVVAQSSATDSAAKVRQQILALLEGEDWSGAIAAIDEETRTLGFAVDNLSAAIGRFR